MNPKYVGLDSHSDGNKQPDVRKHDTNTNNKHRMHQTLDEEATATASASPEKKARNHHGRNAKADFTMRPANHGWNNLSIAFKSY